MIEVTQEDLSVRKDTVITDPTTRVEKTIYEVVKKSTTPAGIDVIETTQTDSSGQ